MKEVITMLLNIACLFVIITMTIQFFGSFTEIVHGKAKLTDYIETLWNALILLAVGIILRNIY